MDEYKNYLDAIRILAVARNEVVRETGHVTNNPAWDKLFRAALYLAKQIEL